MEDNTLNIETILSSVRELQLRLDKLEKENNDLKEIIKVTNFREKNNKILQHIRERPSPSIYFHDWIDYLSNNVEFYLDTVFENDLITAIDALLKDSIDKFANLPIVAFHRKPNLFYYYKTDEKICDGEGSWEILDNSEFTKILSKIDYWFLCKFNSCWYQVNVQNIKNSEEYKNKYDSYYLKILGGARISNEKRYLRIQQNFYKLIREQI